MKLWWLRSTSETCEGLCRHGILVVELLYIAEARAQAKGCLLAGFLYLWCHALVEAAGRFRGLVR
jgi:hypothetical protein